MKQVYPTLLAFVVSTFCLLSCQQDRQSESPGTPIELSYNDLSSLYVGKRVAVRGYLRFQDQVETRLEEGKQSCELLLKPLSYDKELRLKGDPSASVLDFKILLKVKVGDGPNELARPQMVVPLMVSPRSLRFHTSSKDVGVEDLVQVIGILRSVENNSTTGLNESHIEVENIEPITKLPSANSTNAHQ